MITSQELWFTGLGAFLAGVLLMWWVASREMHDLNQTAERKYRKLVESNRLTVGFERDRALGKGYNVGFEDGLQYVEREEAEEEYQDELREGRYALMDAILGELNRPLKV